jgi:tellurite resistance-related uncharacterized protein
MERVITGYHRDDEGDWVAELRCGHNQHVRHRPPFQVRPWVLHEDGRTAHLGTVLGCPLCDRAELPEDLRFVRASPVWDERTMPTSLRGAHRIATNTWGRLVVRDGRLQFSAATAPAIEAVIEATRTQAIPPGVEHHVEPLGPVHFLIEFLAVDREQQDRVVTDSAPRGVDEGISDESGTIND